MSASDFQSTCDSQKGVIATSNKGTIYCRYVSASKTLGNSTNVNYSEIIVGKLNAGNAIYYKGTGAFELYRDTERLVFQAESYWNNPKSGTLKIQLVPGYYANLSVYIVECLNQSGQIISCPF